MADLVTKADAFNHLRFDTDIATGPDAAWLDVWIPGVSAMVMDWLKDWWRVYVIELDASGVPVVDSNGDYIAVIDSSGERETRPQVRIAVLIELAWQNRYRDGDGEHTATGDLYSGRYGYTLSKGATSVLSSLRKPTIS